MEPRVRGVAAGTLRPDALRCAQVRAEVLGGRPAGVRGQDRPSERSVLELGEATLRPPRVVVTRAHARRPPYQLRQLCQPCQECQERPQPCARSHARVWRPRARSAHCARLGSGFWGAGDPPLLRAGLGEGPTARPSVRPTVPGRRPRLADGPGSVRQRLCRAPRCQSPLPIQACSPPSRPAKGSARPALSCPCLWEMARLQLQSARCQPLSVPFPKEKAQKGPQALSCPSEAPLTVVSIRVTA